MIGFVNVSFGHVHKKTLKQTVDVSSSVSGVVFILTCSFQVWSESG